MPSSALRKAVNLKVDSQLVQEAKIFNINLSREFEAHLSALVRQKKQSQWQAENQAALAAYNEHVERDGVFSDELRGF